MPDSNVWVSCSVRILIFSALRESEDLVCKGNYAISFFEDTADTLTLSIS